MKLWGEKSLESLTVEEVGNYLFALDFDFSGRIKAILKDLGLNQTAFASKMNLSQGVISEFASGARLPSKEFIFGLSKH